MQYPQGARRIRKAAKPPTAAQRVSRIPNKSTQSPTQWVWVEKEEWGYGYAVFAALTQTAETEWNRPILT